MASTGWLPAVPDGYLDEAPLVRVIKSTVVKEKDQDLVLHTVEVSYYTASHHDLLLLLLILLPPHYHRYY